MLIFYIYAYIYFYKYIILLIMNYDSYDIINDSYLISYKINNEFY